MNTLQQKLNAEMAEFKKTYETMTPTQIYNDWYIIGFYEAYYELLLYINDNEDTYCGSQEILDWLNTFKNPFGFLYSEWLSADGALSYDWDDMFDFIEEVYKDCMANRH